MGEELCPALGLTIPVGKDSMSMKTRWQEGNEEREMTSPLSLVISAFARVEDVRHTITPQLSTEDNALLLIDLGKGNNALGATALAQVYRQLGDKPADVRDVAQLKGFYDAIQALVAQRKLLAYHDRSDGGLLVTLAEMAFAGHCGIYADIATLGDDRWRRCLTKNWVRSFRFVPLTVKRSSPYWHSMGLLIASIMLGRRFPVTVL